MTHIIACVLYEAGNLMQNRVIMQHLAWWGQDTHPYLVPMAILHKEVAKMWICSFFYDCLVKCVRLESTGKVDPDNINFECRFICAPHSRSTWTYLLLIMNLEHFTLVDTSFERGRILSRSCPLLALEARANQNPYWWL